VTPDPHRLALHLEIPAIADRLLPDAPESLARPLKGLALEPGGETTVSGQIGDQLLEAPADPPQRRRLLASELLLDPRVSVLEILEGRHQAAG